MGSFSLISRTLRAAALLSTLILVSACGDDDPRGGDCPGGQMLCGGACANVLVNQLHCGACNNECGAGQTCDQGMCMGAVECPAGQVPCDNVCTAVQNNFANCGGCGNACMAGQVCTGGVCTGGGIDGGPGFDGGPGGTDSGPITGDCSPACDPDRSSSCGQMGGMGPNQCLCGAFGQCPVGQACVPSGGSFICANLMFDPMNCGRIGNACQEGESCNSGVCGCGGGAACAVGQACCAGGCVDVTSDAMNCGGCGVTCGGGETCAGSSCGCGGGPSCRPPMAGILGMGGDPGQSCCAGACVENTTASCACEMCTGDDDCQVGGGGIIPGMGGEVSVCCGGPEVAILGCGGGFPGI